MARTLTIVERRVSDDERAGYLAALSERRQRAATVAANFWVFEHAAERGRFVEFTEGAGEEPIAALHRNDMPADLWREVQGG
jgi:hypothetical protein